MTTKEFCSDFILFGNDKPYIVLAWCFAEGDHSFAVFKACQDIKQWKKKLKSMFL